MKAKQLKSAPNLALFATIREVAEYFAVNERTVYQWLRDGAPAREQCGRFDALKIDRWRKNHPPIVRPWRYRRPRC